MKRRITSLIIGILIYGMVGLTYADPITYYFSGDITSITDMMGDPLSHDKITIGDVFSGQYTFDFNNTEIYDGNSISSWYRCPNGNTSITLGSMEWIDSSESRLTEVDNGTGHTTALYFTDDGPLLLQFTNPGWDDHSLPSSLAGVFRFTYDEDVNGIYYVVEGETTYFSEAVPEPTSGALIVVAIGMFALRNVRTHREADRPYTRKM
jgi:hypothetical protein